MHNVLAYEWDGVLNVLHLAGDLESIEQAAEILVPAGAPYRSLNADDLPRNVAYRDAWTANFDDQPCVVVLDPAKKAAIDKRLQHEAIESWFEGAVREGFVSETGIALGLTPADVTLLTGNFVLAKECAEQGLPLPPVVDRSGVPHALESINDLTALMLEYGQYRAGLSAEYAAKKAALEV